MQATVILTILMVMHKEKRGTIFSLAVFSHFTFMCVFYNTGFVRNTTEAFQGLCDYLLFASKQVPIYSTQIFPSPKSEVNFLFSR